MSVPGRTRVRPAIESVVVATVVAAIGWVDYATGKDLSFALVYLVPIVAAAWWLSRAASWTAVVTSSVAWVAADVAWADVAPAVTIWNSVTRLAIFVGAVLAVHHVRRTRDRERLDAVAALRASEARYRTLVEGTSDWVWEIDADQRYVYVSPRSFDVLGYLPEELLGQHFLDLMPSGEAERARREIAELAAAGKPLLRYENVNLHKDGREVVLETNGAPILGPSGEFRGYRGIDRDITERNRADAERERLTQQLHEAQRAEAIGRLAGGIAHEFNNMLTVILGSAEFILDSLPPADPVRVDADEIRKAGERARQLTRQLLAFSRRQFLEPRPIDLNSVVLGMDSLLRRVMREDITVVTALVSGVAAVNADPAQLEQVITNLAAHARDAMPAAGTLTIRTGFATIDAGSALPLRPGPFVTLAVQDTGAGMDAASQAHAFEPFFSAKDLTSGSGLGLATVRGVIEQSDGYVKLDSAPGRGTTFTVYLPRVDAHAVLDRPRHATVHTPQRLTVLVVEDEPTVRVLLVRFLEHDGYAVLTAGSPEDALRLAGDLSVQIDLLVSDVVMPGMHGPALAAKLLVSRPTMRLLYVSGYPDTALAHHGVFESGALLLQKPFSREMLADKIREVLA